MTSYSYAFSRTKQFNNLILNNRILRDKFVLGEYNFLQIYQALILNDFLFFYERKVPDTELMHGKKGPNIVTLIRRFLSVIASIWGYLFLILSRRRVLVASSDKISLDTYQCDFRMANLYRCLGEKQIKFLEFLHTIYDEKFNRFLLQRKRPVIYLESVDFICKIFSRLIFFKKDDMSLIESADLVSFGNESEFVKSLLKKYINRISQTKFRINFISKMLRMTNVRVLIAPPDTRNYFELVQSCELNGIKTYWLQSGALCKYDVGLLDCSGRKGKLIKPTKFFLSSQYWIDELLRLGSIFDGTDLAVGGDMKEDRTDTGNGVAPLSDKKHFGVTILVSYETQAIKSEVHDYIKKFLKCPDTRVVFSIRPGKDAAGQLKEYGLQDMPSNFSVTSDLKNAMVDVDVVVGTQSTLLYDLISFLKPVIVLKTEMDMLEGMIENKLADTLDINDSDFCEHLRVAKETDLEILVQRKARLYEGAVFLNKTLEEILL